MTDQKGESLPDLLEWAAVELAGKFGVVRAELAALIDHVRQEERERCAEIAYHTCASTRHVSLGESCVQAIREGK